MNLYAYCNNNPIMFSDPTGCAPWWSIVGTVLLDIGLIGLTIVTGGATLPLLIGAVAGQVLGGITAAGNGTDVWTGMFTGGLLGVLKSIGAPIVDGIILGVDVQKQFLFDAGMKISEIEGALKCDEINLEMMRDRLLNAKWSDELVTVIRKVYELFDNKALCIRSSAVDEDSKENSFAGVFRSNINIRSFGEFLWAIRDCWLSGVEENAVRYSKIIKRPLTPMSVIIQPLIYAISSGVAVIDNDVLTISAAYGQGTGVVGGNVACDTYQMSKNNNNIAEKIVFKGTAVLANYEKQPICFREIKYPWNNDSHQRFYIYKDDTRSSLLHGSFLGMDYEEKMKPVLDDVQREELAKQCFEIADKLGNNNWDFEWCFDNTGMLFIMQVRPLLSTLAPQTNEISHDKPVLTKGMPISAGSYSGRCIIVTCPEDYAKVNSGDIVYLDVILDSFVNILSKIGALLLSNASSLSHCAIIAREWKIPCVGGINKNSLRELSYYEVDGSNGMVYHSNNTNVVSSLVTKQSPEPKSLLMYPYAMMAFECVASKISTIEDEMIKWKKSLNEYTYLNEVDCDGIFSIVYNEESLNSLYSQIVKKMIDVTLANSLLINVKQDTFTVLKDLYGEEFQEKEKKIKVICLKEGM